MLVDSMLWVAGQFPSLRKAGWRTLHEILGWKYAGFERWTHMNYGYADLAENAAPLLLKAADESERYCIQLYVHVVGNVDLAGKDVLEVGCGRGGGVSYIARYLRPRRIVGLDVAGSQVKFCQRVHGDTGAEFIRGDAENLPFDVGSFDAVINVESSFCYGNVERFFREVRRVLKPGGHFLYADVRLKHELDRWVDQLAGSGLVALESHDISGNVMRALELDGDRREVGLEILAPRFAKGIMRAFIGVRGSRIPVLLKSGMLVYLCIHMQNFGASIPAADLVSFTEAKLADQNRRAFS